MIEESKYCSEVMKKYFNKKLVMTKEDIEDYRNSTKCWVHDYVDNDVKVRDHFDITGKYRGSATYGPSLPILSRVSRFFQGSPDLLNQDRFSQIFRF